MRRVATLTTILFAMAPVFQVWAWKENVWEKEKGTLLERYTVEQSKPSAEGGGVLSTLTINNVMESDFLSTYNCTAWNAFGPGTMIITLEETGTLSCVVDIMDESIGDITSSPPPEEVPVGIIAAGTVGSTIILFIFLLVLVLIFYRQRKGSESFSRRISSLRDFSVLLTRIRP